MLIVDIARRVSPLLLCIALCEAAAGEETQWHREKLENGVTLLLAPYAEARVVAVESFYSVGFCDEPAGLTQAAHLLEHLMCYGATASYGQGETFSLLRKLGMTNAETLPTFTHYDYSVPPHELETVFKIEGERLTSLKITPELVRAEADKCAEEAQMVHETPQSGMVKHAFMALFQFWNHGLTEVRVRLGLEQTPVDKLESLWRSQYRPDQLTMVVVGEFSKDAALEFARKHLGAIQGEKSPALTVNWPAVSPRGHVTWDANVHAVCVYAPPPAQPQDRQILSLWGLVLMQRLAMKPELGELAHMTFTSNTTWPVGELPFFVYAAAKSKQQTAELERTIKDALEEESRSLKSDIIQMRTFAGQGNSGPAPRWGEVQKQAADFAKASGRAQQDAISMVLLNVALQWGLREMSGPALPVDEITEERLKAAIEATLAPDKLKVVTLGPPPETKP